MGETYEAPYCTLCQSRLDSVFQGVEPDNLQELSTRKSCNFFKKGQIIFREGDRPTGLYCLHSGKVKLFKTGDEGRDHIVRFAKPGDVLGYQSLVTGREYTVSAASLDDAVICCIPKELIFELLRSSGGFSMQVIQLLSQDLGRAEEKMMHLAQKPVRERLAEALLLLREVYGTENGDESAINIKLSRDELASVVGTATETLVRTIADLKRENLIATDKKKIRILDLHGLIEAGNLHD